MRRDRLVFLNSGRPPLPPKFATASELPPSSTPSPPSSSSGAPNAHLRATGEPLSFATSVDHGRTTARFTPAPIAGALRPPQACHRNRRTHLPLARPFFNFRPSSFVVSMRCPSQEGGEGESETTTPLDERGRRGGEGMLTAMTGKREDNGERRGKGDTYVNGWWVSLIY